MSLRDNRDHKLIRFLVVALVVVCLSVAGLNWVDLARLVPALAPLLDLPQTQ